MRPTERTGPLAGVKIIDMSSVVLGPFATLILADLGAEVIKVENMTSGASGAGGDIMRYAGASPTGDTGPIYAALNRNKKCITLDVKTQAGKEALTALLSEADVFFHNVRMAGMERLGFGYEAVKALKQDMVYVHCAGFGQDGPYAARQAYDDLIQCASGYASLHQMRSGGDPAYAPSLIADKTVGLFAVYATLAALFHKQKTGEGQFVQTPMLEAFTFFHMVENLYGATYEEGGRMAYTRSINPRRKPYRTADGYIGVVPYSDKQWEVFFAMGGREGVFSDPRFSSYKARTENIGALYGIIEEVALTKTTQEWLDLLEDAQIPAMRFNTMEHVLSDPHLQAVNFFQTRQLADGVSYKAMRHPIHFSKTPPDIVSEPKPLGADTENVLAGLGL